jgi:pyridoxal 5'-phosphate synthase pdxS subunit
MAKSRIGHIVEAEILQAIGVDYIDECVFFFASFPFPKALLTGSPSLRSEVLTPADPSLHVDKHVRFSAFLPFLVCL